MTSHTHSWSDIKDKPTTFKPSSHTHDDRYYTETEITTKLNDKSNTNHTHSDLIPWSCLTELKSVTFAANEWKVVFLKIPADDLATMYPLGICGLDCGGVCLMISRFMPDSSLGIPGVIDQVRIEARNMSGSTQTCNMRAVVFGRSKV